MTSKYRRKKDRNHNEVVRDLRHMLFNVIDTHRVGQVVPGFPDCIVIRGGWVRLVEIKAKGKRDDLTSAEHEFRHVYGEAMIVAESADEVLSVYNEETD